MARYTFSSLQEHVGKELGLSQWWMVDQTMIDAFAETTGDRQWIHVDIEKARKMSPFGATIAHGYLTLSLVAPLSYEIGVVPEDAVAAFNYGSDKVRYLAPVKAGARVRMRTVLISFEPRRDGEFLMKCANTIEIEGEDKPALFAETLTVLVAASSS